MSEFIGIMKILIFLGVIIFIIGSYIYVNNREKEKDKQVNDNGI